MNDAGGSHEELATRTLIGRAGEIVVRGKDGPPGEFVSLLYAGAAPEDLSRYDAKDLALLASDAWRFLQDRPPGLPKIRVAAPADSEGLSGVSVIEIANDDMPFLVDSVMAEISDRGLGVHLVLHPVMPLRRDGERLAAFGHAARDAEARESFIHIHVDRIDDDTQAAALRASLQSVLEDVRLAVTDWWAMLTRAGDMARALQLPAPPLPAEDRIEAARFLEWMTADNFLFLGLREDNLENGTTLVASPKSALGVLRAAPERLGSGFADRIDLPADAQAQVQEAKALIITKTSLQSQVHRRAELDQVGVRQYDAAGKLTGLLRIVGLFTSVAYNGPARAIPDLRRKIASVTSRAGFDPASHSGKALANILDTYPRDELLQIDEDTLLSFASAILQLGERPRLRVLPRHDRFDRFVSVLVYVPRDRYGSQNRIAIGAFLAQAYGGHVTSFSPYFPEGQLVRVHFVITRAIGLTDGYHHEPSRTDLERGIADIIRSWGDALDDALGWAHPGKASRALLARYGAGFPPGYRDAYAPTVAVADIAVMEGLSAQNPLGVQFYQRDGEDGPQSALKIWNFDVPIALSARVPVLEQMGFKVVDESTFHIQTAGAGAPDYWLHDMTLEPPEKADMRSLRAKLEACFIEVMRGGAEDDGFNALVLAAGLDWRDVALVRTISRYLRQIRLPYSQGYMSATLVKHAEIAKSLVALFHHRFTPQPKAGESQRGEREAASAAEIDAALAAVDSLDEDRIIRHFVNATQSALRTNYFQPDDTGKPKTEISIKFDSGKIDGMPLPRPLREIFIYSPRLEAVHLRFGKVARGGIRWSDRPQDFRTEVLGLVKAQQVKNAVIVPVGAKGGFVPKLIPVGASRDAVAAEGVATYKLFMSALLDITDNLEPAGLVPPRDVVRHDGDDPYLVVAADKGTATFSDIANGIAQEHGFWLDDAFASGGSAGYDHKKMGITARGAWESVKRHFREMNIDIARTAFTAVGVGDMSGDVFGNGMLRETTTRLLAAFDHRDIFIDPDPDAAKSFAERQRLFDLPRSSWKDYDASLISAGGGVFSRQVKEITLSPAAQAAIGLAKPKATPAEVMNAILRAPVDLLFFGGIGTYVRASHETDEAAGDRANDSIRASGADLRCKVVGEGANLGMTQHGRIEAAARGVRLNTDAIDNSAGVNTSDVEVNIKIALSLPMRDGRLSRADRDVMMAGMTDEVAALVLRNNYQQTLALSLAQRRGVEDLGFQQRMMQLLEQRQLLDRAVEYLPDDMALSERGRRGEALTRPELAILLAYAKLSLNSDLLASAVPDDAYLGRELGRYFPPTIAARFPDVPDAHRLRREIISTQLANSMINRGGATLIVRIADQTGASADRIAAAFAAVRDSYGMTALNTQIEDLDNKIASDLQLSLFADVQNLLLDRIVWFLRNVDLTQGLGAIVDHYRAGIAEVSAALGNAMPADAQALRLERIAEFKRKGVPDALAERIADVPLLKSATDVVQVAERTGRSVADVARTYFAATAYFRLDQIAAAAAAIKITDYFDRLALDRAVDAIGDAERRLAAEMGDGVAGADAVARWAKTRSHEVERVRQAVNEIAMSGMTLSKLSLTASMLGDLVRR